MREPTAPAYYDRRAAEYDDWYLGKGLYAERERDGFAEELGTVAETLAALAPARTLDVACGTGFLTRHLPGELTGLDQSASMLEVAASRMPSATFVQGDALAPPFAPGSFERVHAGHFYGHLTEEQRGAFLDVARGLAGELVVTDSALRPGGRDEAWDERTLSDGSRHQVYKRWFTAHGLGEELGGGETVHDGPWFVSVRMTDSRRA
jgi:SAM-dependent methyltransferase